MDTTAVLQTHRCLLAIASMTGFHSATLSNPCHQLCSKKQGQFLQLHVQLHMCPDSFQPERVFAQQLHSNFRTRLLEAGNMLYSLSVRKLVTSAVAADQHARLVLFVVQLCHVMQGTSLSLISTCAACSVLMLAT